MLTSIMRSLGYIPFDRYQTAMNEISEVKSKAAQVVEQSRVTSDRNDGLASERKLLEDKIKRLDEVNAIFNSILAEIISGRANPQFAVNDDGKTVVLQGVLGADMIVIKSTVKNNKNLDHLTSLAKALNLMMVRRSEIVSRMVKEALARPTPQQPAPLDKPVGNYDPNGGTITGRFSSENGTRAGKRMSPPESA